MPLLPPVTMATLPLSVMDSAPGCSNRMVGMGSRCRSWSDRRGRTAEHGDGLRAHGDPVAVGPGGNGPVVRVQFGAPALRLADVWDGELEGLPPTVDQH